ncbi:MAG: iron-containing alcohol dehydrogenase, partial [Lachnospiraceae bacterium]|nr:iron-containing alcohol dehydrogenase [Lachnospiraceae bacterium]
MNNFIFENRTKVYFGRGCVKEYLASLLRDHETIMFAYGCGSIKKNGIYDEVLYILQKEGKTIVEFPEVAPNPSYEKVMEGIELARKHK